jgi:hypothetical protein
MVEIAVALQEAEAEVEVDTLVFAPGGGTLFTLSARALSSGRPRTGVGLARWWDIDPGWQRVRALPHPHPVWAAAFSSPAVSTMVNSRSPSRARASRRSRVTPGRSSTSAWRLPISRLNSVDLPTLGRPMMAMVKLMLRPARGGTPGPSHCRTL